MEFHLRGLSAALAVAVFVVGAATIFNKTVDWAKKESN